MYQINETKKHDISTFLINAATTIISLNSRLERINPEFKSEAAEDVLQQLQSAQRTLDNLLLVGEKEPEEVWVDLDSDVQTIKKA